MPGLTHRLPQTSLAKGASLEGRRSTVCVRGGGGRRGFSREGGREGGMFVRGRGRASREGQMGGGRYKEMIDD